MLAIATQISIGLLVCPRTHLPLAIEGEHLRVQGSDSPASMDSCYPLVNGVPVLLLDRESAEKYVQGSRRMMDEYRQAAGPEPKPSAWVRGKRGLRSALGLVGDHRTPQSDHAFRAVFDSLAGDSLGLSIGGGPGRSHPRLVNLNIGLFPNVEVVADAHDLPYRDGSVDAIYCEAVLEHLARPARAVTEMLRVLKPGGKVFAATPFLAAYHGYPNHFQNFTTTGHSLLFESAGFKIQESGACVGPTFMLVDLIDRYIQEYFPKPLNRVVSRGWSLTGIFIRKLDHWIGKRPNAYVLAATTYVVASKP